MRFSPKSFILVRFSAPKSKMFFNHDEKLYEILPTNPSFWCVCARKLKFSSTFFGELHHFWGNIVKDLNIPEFFCPYASIPYI